MRENKRNVAILTTSTTHLHKEAYRILSEVADVKNVETKGWVADKTILNEVRNVDAILVRVGRVTSEVIDAAKKLHIFMNVEKRNLDTLLKQLPALKRPTISELSDPDWFAVNTVIDKDKFMEILPTLRQLAQGLVLYEPLQVLPLEDIVLENSK